MVNNVKMCRRMRRLTALELAHSIGRSEPHVYRVERGTVGVDQEEAARIADALSFPLHLVFPDASQRGGQP